MIRQRASVLLVAIALLTLGACGASQRTKTLKASLIVLNTTYDTVIAVSDKREHQIVDDALAQGKTKDQVKAEIAEWRAKVDPFLDVAEKAYKAIWSASMLEDSSSLAKALGLVKDVQQLAGGLK